MNSKKWTMLVALGMLTMASTAMAAGKGTSVFAIELGQGTTTVSSAVATGATPDYISLGQFPEINVQAEYWYMFSDDYAMNLSGGIGFGAITEDPNDTAADTKDEFTSSSVRFRVGGDRVGSVGDRFTVFAGPGFEYVTATQKFEFSGPASGEAESASTTYIGLSGRVGAMMKLGESMSIVGRVGNSFGRASSTADTGNAETSGWVNSFDAAWGLAFAFGAQ